MTNVYLTRRYIDEVFEPWLTLKLVELAVDASGLCFYTNSKGCRYRQFRFSTIKDDSSYLELVEIHSMSIFFYGRGLKCKD